jgi:triphosphatase
MNTTGKLDEQCWPATVEPRVSFDRLRLRFVTRFLRTAYNVTLPDGSIAEVAIDSGAIEARGRTAPISEIEIELKSGDPAALYSLGLDLARDLPLRVGVQSKAERGYALGRARSDAPRKASRVAIEPDMPLGRAAAHVASACLGQMLANEEGFLRGRDIEFLHQLRVGSRRLRAALSAFAPVLPAEELDAVRDELRWLSQTLGPARDWDVWCLETLPKISATTTTSASRAPFEGITRRSQLARRAANGAARSALESPRYTVLLLRLGRLLSTALASADGGRRGRGRTNAAVRPVSEHAEKILVERSEKLRRCDPLVEAAEGWHETRIQAKKLRYASEFFRPMFSRGRDRRRRGVAIDRLVEAATQVQDILGLLNDTAVAERLLLELTESDARSDPNVIALVRGWLAGRATGASSALPAAWRALTAVDLER